MAITRFNAKNGLTVGTGSINIIDSDGNATFSTAMTTGSLGVGTNYSSTARMFVSGTSTTTDAALVVKAGTAGQTGYLIDAQTSGGTSKFSVDPSGNVSVGGNLSIAGTTTTINSTTVNIDDNIIQLNTQNPTQSTGGIYVADTTVNTTGSLIWDSSTNQWLSGLAGSEVALPAGTGTTSYVTRWTGTNTLGASSLYDDGTNVALGTATTNGNKLSVNGTTALTGSVLPGVTTTYDLGSSTKVWNNVYANTLSGSHTKLADGTSFLIAGNNVTISTGSNGAITINSSAASVVAGSDTQVQFNDGGNFGASSGLAFNKTTQAVTGTYVVASTGFSGSLTRLTNGTSYLVAGSNITISTGSNGSVTIGSAAAIAGVTAGTGLTGGGSSGTVTLSINDSVVATVSGTTFTGLVRVNGGISGSLTSSNVSAGQVVLAGTGGVVSGSNAFWWDNTNANVGIGTSSFTGRLFVSGSATGTTTTLLARHGVVNGANLPVLDVQNSAGTSLLFVSGSGNVGIGTNVPTDKLYVSGTVQVRRNAYVGSSATGNAIVVGTSGGSQIGFPQVGSNDELTFITHTNGVSHAERMRITAAGNVGIGTTTTGDKLAVNGSLSVTGSTLPGTSNTYTLGSTSKLWSTVFATGLSGSLTKLSDGTSYLIAGNNLTITTGSNGAVTIAGAAGTITGSGTANYVMKYSGTSTATTSNIYDAGSGVGIGATTFTGQFYVSGSSTGTTTTILARHGVAAGSNLPVLDIQSSAGTSLLFVSGGGAVGIGTNLPAAKFEVVGSAGSLFSVTDANTGALLTVNNSLGQAIFQVNSDSTLVAGDYNANVLVVTSSFVGIGTSSTAARLFVSGTSTSVLPTIVAKAGISSPNGAVLDVQNSAGTSLLFVSGSGNVGIGTTSTGDKLAVNGSMSVTGSLLPGTNNTYDLGSSTKLWNDVYATAFSGSLTKLTDGTSYIVAGNNVTITTGSNGSVTIASTATGGGDSAASYLVLSATGSLTSERVFTPGTGITTTDGGAGGNYTIGINDSVVATVSGATFTGVTKHSSGLSGSLTNLTDGTSYLIAGSNVTITTGSNGSVVIAATSASGVTGTGTTNYVSKWSSSSALSDSSIYDNGTSIGIGTNSPAADKVHVLGSSSATSTTTIIQGGATPQSGVGTLDVQNSAGTSLLFVTGTLASVGGRVGIGTASPDAKLQVSASYGGSSHGISIGQPNIFGLASNVYTSIQHSFLSGDGTTRRLVISSDGNVLLGGTLGILATPARLYVTGSSSSSDGTLLVKGGVPSPNGSLLDVQSSAGSTLFFVSGSGNIGIGTTSTGDKLAVNGSMSVTGSLLPGTNNTYDLGSSTNLWNDVYATALTGSLTKLSDGTSYLIAGSNTTISTGSSGAVTISSTGTITGVTAGTGLTGGGSSGTVTLSISDSVVATVSGTTFTGVTKHNAGLSGSLTNLTDGTSYLIAGSGVSIISGSNGAVTITSTASSTPGGSNTYVQFNDGGSFGGDSGLTYNKTTDALTSSYVVASTGFSGSLTRLTDGTSYLIAGSNVTITTGSSGAVTIASSAAAGTVSGTGTTNYLSKFTGTSTIGNSAIYDNGTSVGINTASPTANAVLDVNGSVRVTGYFRRPDDVGVALSIGNGVETHNQDTYNFNNAVGNITFSVLNSTGLGVYTTPSATLHISGSSTSATPVAILQSGIAAPTGKVLDVRNQSGTTVASIDYLGNISANTASFSGDVSITGNLTVLGTQTIISSSQVNIGDNIILLNSVANPQQYGGIYVADTTANTTGSLLWNSNTDRWTAGLVGNETNLVTTGSTDNLYNKTLPISGLNSSTISGGTQGGIGYFNTSGYLSSSAAGTSGQILQSAETSSPTWVNFGTLVSSNNVITGSGTAGYHAKFTSGNAVSNGVIYDDGTNVAVGTTSTNGNRFSVSGTTALSGSTLPGITNTYDLGSTSSVWRGIFASSGSFSALVTSASTTSSTYAKTYAPGEAGKLTATKDITAAGTATVALEANNGAVMFDITIVASESGFSVAKKYTVATQYGASPVVFKIVDTGPFSGADFTVSFSKPTASKTLCTITNSDSSTHNFAITLDVAATSTGATTGTTVTIF